MTETDMDLSELLATQDGGDFLRGVAEAVPQPIVEANGDGPIGAGRYLPRNLPRRQDRLGDRDHRCRSQERSSASGLGHPRQRPSGWTSRAVSRPRGLDGPKLAIGAAHRGLRAGIERVFEAT